MDEADRAQMSIETVIDATLAEAMRKAAEIPIGTPGECDTCGSYSLRIVDGMCCPCIDRYTNAGKRNGKMFR